MHTKQSTFFIQMKTMFAPIIGFILSHQGKVYPLCPKSTSKVLQHSPNTLLLKVLFFKSTASYSKHAFTSNCSAFPQLLEYPQSCQEGHLSGLLGDTPLCKSTGIPGRGAIDSVSNSNHPCSPTSQLISNKSKPQK